MSLTPEIKKITGWYEADNPGSKASLVRLLNHGRLGGAGTCLSRIIDIYLGKA